MLISNPNSTSQTPRVFRQVIAILQAVPGIRLHARPTHHAGHARTLCADIEPGRFDAVVVLGGDGTVNEAVNGLLGPVSRRRDGGDVPALGIIPTGSANVFARALGYSADPVRAARALAAALRARHVRSICLGTWEDRWFAVNAGVGIDATVIARVERARSRGFSATPLRYLVVCVDAWVRAQLVPPRMDVTARGPRAAGLVLRRVPLCVASNTNPWTFLGPLPVVTNPENSFDRGLGVFALTSLSGPGGVASMLHLVGVGHNRWFERWINRRTVRCDDATEVVLTCPQPRQLQIDGEYVGDRMRVELGCVPDALRVIAPLHRARLAQRSWPQILRDFVRLS
nr:diacylglycerol kinase family protein [Corynebacterium sp. c6VSa_13]